MNEEAKNRDYTTESRKLFAKFLDAHSQFLVEDVERQEADGIIGLQGARGAVPWRDRFYQSRW